MQGAYSNTCNANGKCNCKANVVGNKCNTCSVGFYNFPTCQGKLIIILHKFIFYNNNISYLILFHFSACNCNTQGSFGNTCNDNGECSCKANVINDKCNTCADGFFNFPTCQGKYYLHNF